MEDARAIERVAVIGAGAWGTALALTLARAGRSVSLWARESEVVAAIRATRENPLFLPRIALPAAITPTGELAQAIAGAQAVFMVVPSQYLRTTAKALAAHGLGPVPLVIAAKGVEHGSGALMGEIIAAELPSAVPAVLSGPTFAREVAQGLPTAVTLALAPADQASGRALIAAIGTPNFRPYLSDDIIGAEIGGAAKNVIAIACGIAEGRGFGMNARAALITRGLAEITRLGLAKGGRLETFQGLSGLGDLVLTCTSTQSRNFSFGVGLGAGRPMAELLAGPAVVEGVENAASICALAARLDVDLPICSTVNALIHEGAEIDAAVHALLARPFRAEGR
jgi:glycerol-3-phosphate dehydrogenase (NAD(P)+)